MAFLMNKRMEFAHCPAGDRVVDPGSRLMISLTRYCPNCWIETGHDEQACPKCGFRMAAFDALGDEGRLLLALRHPNPVNRLLAIRLLGDLKCRTAVPVFAAIIDEDENPCVLGEIAAALAQIGGDQAQALLDRLGGHPSVIVRHAVADVRRSMPGGDSEVHEE
jgi:HEAT repeats